MTRLRNIGPNQTEIKTGDRTVLYSYSTPVVVHVHGIGYFRTETRYSKTTSKHINQYLISNVDSRFCNVATVSQSKIDTLSDGGSI